MFSRVILVLPIALRIVAGLDMLYNFVQYDVLVGILCALLVQTLEAVLSLMCHQLSILVRLSCWQLLGVAHSSDYLDSQDRLTQFIVFIMAVHAQHITRFVPLGSCRLGVVVGAYKGSMPLAAQ